MLVRQMSLNLGRVISSVTASNVHGHALADAHRVHVVGDDVRHHVS